MEITSGNIIMVINWMTGEKNRTNLGENQNRQTYQK